MVGISPIAAEAKLATLAQVFGANLGAAVTTDDAGGSPAVGTNAAALAVVEEALARQAVTYRAYKAGAAALLQLVQTGLPVGQHVDARV